jgi:hypothetical protein
MRPPSGRNLKALNPDLDGQGDECPSERPKSLG